MKSGYIPLGERMSNRGRFIPLLLDRIPPLRWLRRLLPSGQSLVILVPYLWLLAFFVVPFVIVAKISLSDQATAMPPFDLADRIPDSAAPLLLLLYFFWRLARKFWA